MTTFEKDSYEAGFNEENGKTIMADIAIIIEGPTVTFPYVSGIQPLFVMNIHRVIP